MKWTYDCVKSGQLSKQLFFAVAKSVLLRQMGVLLRFRWNKSWRIYLANKEHLRTRGNVENTISRRVFSTFLKCSQMSGVFYHSLLHEPLHWVALRYGGNVAKNYKTCFFYVLYSDKTWVFDLSERELFVKWIRFAALFRAVS